jgi:large subunit ribosomal protein L31e
MAEERLHTIPLADAYDYIRTKRTRRAVTIVRKYVSRHAKVPLEAAKVSEALNIALWARGIQKPPRKIRVRIVMDKDSAKAYLEGEKTDQQIAKEREDAKKKAEAAKAKPEAKEEKKAEAKTEAAPEPKAKGAAKAEKPAREPAAVKKD